MRLVNKLLRSPSGALHDDQTPPQTPMTPGTPGFDTDSAPFMRPADVNVRHISGIFQPAALSSRGILPKTVVEKPLLPEASKETPPEMLPILSQLAAHNVRPYHEGYFMLLSDLNNDGKAPANRQWEEVFGTLRGTQLATWNATELEQKGADAHPHYINIDDATFKSVPKLPSPGGELSNIIVLSTTMKNRYLMQFSSAQAYQTWTSALRLAMFERTSLQEAYTGALLSCKGTQLNGIRSLLGPTKVRRDGWCSVRFGAGMPWRRVWFMATPGPLLTAKEHKQASVPGLPELSKKERANYGRIAFYESAKNLKKPLAIIVRAHSAYALFPEKAILMDMSSLLKIEGHVIFAGEEKEAKLSMVHVMPDPRPCIQGFEILIRFLIPVFDVFNLYGRPQRLNADKADMRSLLFAMPTLPHVYYCDIADVQMLLSQSGWENWDCKIWIDKIRELLARKIATGYRGLGNIHDFSSDHSSIGAGSFAESSNDKTRAARAVSQPGRMNVPNLQASSSDSLPQSIDSHSTGSHMALGQSQENLIKEVRAKPAGTYNAYGGQPQNTRNQTQFGANQQQAPARPLQVYPKIAPSGRVAPPPPSDIRQPKRPSGSRPMPGHERSQSEGQDPNTLIIAPGSGPLTPTFNNDSWAAKPENRNSEVSVSESFQSASDTLDQNRPNTASTSSVNVFDPGYRRPTANTADPAVANEAKDRAKHNSYAQYSDYIETYIPNQGKTTTNDAAAQRPALLEIKKVEPDVSHAPMPTTPVNVMSPPLSFDSPSAISQARNTESPTSAAPASTFQNPYGTRNYGGASSSDLVAPRSQQQQRRPSGPRDPTAQLQQSPQRKYPNTQAPQTAQPMRVQPAMQQQQQQQPSLGQVFGQLLSQPKMSGVARPHSPGPQGSYGAHPPQHGSPGQQAPLGNPGYNPYAQYSQPPIQSVPNPYAQYSQPPVQSQPKQQGPYPGRPNAPPLMQQPTHSHENLGGRRGPPQQGPYGTHVYAQAQPRPHPPGARRGVPSSPSHRPVAKGQMPPGSTYSHRSDGPYAAVPRS
ncbi:hypothetical protein B9G98_00493 [Wickerhamiella sorbophila]|uniref:PH domain-containing protein n=1 Tax=Wickerhamiella sorbophila TaxID=45607 RepID=A0A2T0FCY4_9ASCO|nr:hypothetical protein B9G98_00493 [Wickerhamiella sorbophila]PRT52873.1 hypothetical protein B9G98_00493 [Wickerhamiella sorbophila]